ncbi:MAG: class I SAM-dependent methyltransferase [Prevotellaceae bacterium]|jgi:2-polyprenyl-3-methyl-5-hydroxy-6-metoxy-1,4-benzoquinol methylase|nr:class I SAM-dependent methyltransferase [Prevotellaceae bacterium]
MKLSIKTNIKMTEFWESSFLEKQTMWGFEPAESAITAKDFFVKEKVKDILIPGIGYGRNAKIFLDNEINVTGIEISKTAIDLARSQNKLDIQIHHGSVTDMPFDNKFYDGIYCYALIHLLNNRERRKFIKDCYNRLKPNGYMIFSTISKDDSMYGKGKQLSKNRFLMSSGAKLFFYDSDFIKQEFGKYGLVEFLKMDEPVKFEGNHPPLKFTVVKCKK